MANTVSVIVPVYNESANLPVLYEEIRKLTQDEATYDWEIIFMDNHSTDDSFSVIQKLIAGDTRVRGIRLSRNFGYQTNIMTGYSNAVGDAVVQLDADGEDDPKMISQFLRHWEKGFKVVYGIRRERKESYLLSLQRRIFYRVIGFLSNISIPADAGDFRLLDRAVVDHLKTFQESNAYLRGLISYIGFEQVGIPYDRRDRFSGKSKFSYWEYLKLALDGVTSFSRKPLMLCAWVGFGMAAFSFIAAAFYFCLYFSIGKLVPGFTTIVLIQFFLAGVQLLSIGLMGTYVGRIFDEVKKRPQGIIESMVAHGKSV